MYIVFEKSKKTGRPSLVVSAFGADSMAQITQATAQLAQELAQIQKERHMIDWASGWFPCSYDSEKLNSGLIASLLPTGEIEWVTHKKTIVEGSIQRNLH